MATLTNKRRRELEALRMKMLRGEIRRIARKDGRTLSEAEVNEQVVNFEAFREKVGELESSGSYTARNTSVGGKKPTSASGKYQFVKGSVGPAYNRVKRLAGKGLPEFEELLKHKDAAKADPVLQDMLFTADILQKNIQDKTGKKKPGEGDRLLAGVFAGNQRAASDLYVQGHHTDIKSKNIRDYAREGFDAATTPDITTVGKQPFEYAPEERQAIANAYKVDPSGEFAGRIQKSIDAQKIETPTAPEDPTSGRLAIQAAIDAQNQEAPVSGRSAIQAVIDAQKIETPTAPVQQAPTQQALTQQALTQRPPVQQAPTQQAPRSGDTFTQPIMAGPVTRAPTQQIPVSEYSPEERQAIANAYKVDPSGEFAGRIQKSIAAQKNRAPRSGDTFTQPIMAGPVDRSSIMAGPVTRAPTSQYSPEELDAIAKAHPLQRTAVKESIDAQKRIAAGETPTIVEAQQFPTPRNLLAEKAPTQQAPTSQYSPEELDAIAKAHPLQKTAVKKSIDAQKRLEIEKRGREAVEKQYGRKVADLDTQAPTSQDGSIQEELVSPLGATESEAEVIPEVLSTPSGMQYGGELPLVTSEQIARATEIERRRREAVARKYRRGLGYASSELTGQRNPFAGGGMVYDYAGGGEVAARGLASLGRGPDTELVHMSSREVGALDDLARSTGLRGLPVNPQTGLPETGILDTILPIAVGAGAAALAPFTGGGSLAAALANPWVVGGTAALGAGIASGFDTAQMAKWGLGVGSGASMFGSLASAGSAAPAQQLAAGTTGGTTAVAPGATGEAVGRAIVGGGAPVTAAPVAAEKAALEAAKDRILQSKIAQAQATFDIPARELAKAGSSNPIWRKMNYDAGKQALAEVTASAQVPQTAVALPNTYKDFIGLGGASSTTPISAINPQYAGLSPAEAGRLYRQTTATGTLGNTLPSSPMFGDIARQKGMEQLSAAGRGITTSSGRQALIGSGIGKARQAGTLGFTPIAAGLGSMAASEYTDQPKFTPVEMPTTESYYPEGGYRAPPRKSIDPFRGERTVTDSGEALYFDPEPYTYPGYVPNEITTSREGIASTETLKAPGIFGAIEQRVREEEEERRRQAQGLFYARAGGIVPYSNGGEVVDTGEATYFAPDRATTLPQAAYSPDVARMMQNANLWQNASDQGVHIRDYAHMSPAERGKYGDPYYGSALEGRKATGIEAMPQGGVDRDIGELAYFNQGGLTQGPGDGMSDDIMLPITGTPDIAAVSPDEFVVPADVVSGLGNGSTSAGARQLYSMMDKVRDSRTGKTAQPRAINPARMMPV